MNISQVVADVTKLAHTVSAYIPQAAAVEDAINLGQKVIGIIDDLTKKHPNDSERLDQQQLQEARAVLATRVKAHAKSTSANLRG
jgi:hypothetical protein